MKGSILAVASAMAVTVSAGVHHHARHAHDSFHNIARSKQNETMDTCVPGCVTSWVTSYGQPTYVPVPGPASTKPAPAPTSPAAQVPTPLATVCPTPGVYTIPSTTVTLTETTTVCAATSTSVPAGPVTYGGVTTVVVHATTVVCPYATVTTSNGVTTSTILTTSYVCPSAGTYTIAPTTTSCASETVIVYPTPAVYTPGTYHQPEVVTTITEESVVVVCPFTAVPTPAPTAPAAGAVTTVAAPPAPAKNTPAAAPPAPATPAPAGQLGNSGTQWAITYTPYTSTGQCKSASDVAADMADIKSKGFTTVRLYSSDCSGLVNVGAACASVGLEIILGIFIDNTGIQGAQSQVTDLVAFAHWNIVVLVVVGNEAIFNGYASTGALVTFIESCRTAFAGCGYNGLITTTEPLNILQANAGSLCGAIDVVGCNIHAFFNSDVDAASAGSFVASQLSIVDSLCPGKTGVNLETGWPSAGQCNGKACPSPENQKTAIESIASSCGGKSVMFSYVNDEWKDAGAFDCEKSWGVIHLY